MVCWSKWGIGVKYGNDPENMSYGYAYPGLDPRDFEPDYPECSKEEIETWKAACLDWEENEEERIKERNERVYAV